MDENIGCAFATIILLVGRKHTYTLFSDAVHGNSLTAWVLNLVLYIGLMVSIAYRLWWANQRVSRLYTDSGNYSRALHTILESGSVFAGATIVTVGLAAANNAAVIAALSPITQLAVRLELSVARWGDIMTPACRRPCRC